MVILIKIVDKYIGNVLCNFLGLFVNQNHQLKSDPRKILVIQLWGVGESILTLPSFEALREKYPGSSIGLLATKRNKDVYLGNKNIDRIILLKQNPFSIALFILKNFRKYDLVIDMEEYLNVSAIISFFAGKFRVGYSHDKRSKLYSVKVNYNDKQHVVQTYLDLARALGIGYDTDRLPNLFYSKKDKIAVDNFLKKNGIKKDDFLICISPGAAESAKSGIWPLERHAELCEELIDRHKARIIMTGTQEEGKLIENIMGKIEDKSNIINAAGSTSLNQLFYLVSKCRLFIGNDAGPMHIAAAQNVKTIGLFGPNIPLRFAPYGKHNIGLYKGHNCEFSPCINVHKGEVPDCLFPKSSNDYQKCMKNISVNDVLKEVERLLT